jgi:2,4-diaminopentanoate dehydrogenase
MSDESHTRPPYRVIVFGPGGLGSVAIWEINRLPEFELVGVRAYSEAKAGVDVGELIGCDPIGVAASTDVEELLAIDCDCVIYTARDLGTFHTDDEVLQILAAGRNVVTPLPYQSADLLRDDSFLGRLQEACLAGQATFHATGLDPDLISDRVLVALTGLCTDIKHVTLKEMWECDAVPVEILQMLGMGQPPEIAEQTPVAVAVSTNLLQAIGRGIERTLGVTYSRIEETHDYVPADRELRARTITIPAGTVGRVTHRFRGWVDGDSADPFFTMEYNWFIAHEMLPAGVAPGEYWVAEIEGTPSARMVIDLRTSLNSDERFYTIGSLRTEPGYHGVIAPCLQAIPLVCEAPPGLAPTHGPGPHWMRDLRQLTHTNPLATQVGP